MVSSLDGFIAKRDGSTSWMQSTDVYENGTELTQEYIADFLTKINCYVMGSKTYEHALELGWPYGDKPVVVASERSLPKKTDNVSFYAGNLAQLVNDELKPKYKNIWMVGGAKLTKEFLQAGLADGIVISIMPIILGDGILFFDFIGREMRLHLKDATAYKDGMTELSYEIVKSEI